MTVLEVGMILNGIPVFRADYHQEIKGDPILRSGMFAAIQSFARVAFGDQAEELRLKNLVICMLTIAIEGIEFSLYAVCDKKTKFFDSVKKALKKVGSRLVKMNKPINSIHLSKNEYLRPIFAKEFKNLRMRAEDRVKGMFR